MLLLTTRFTIAHLFNHTFFFSFLFRTVLIRFADRGLVDKGRPNIGLFNKLFWTILLTYCCYALMMVPVLVIIKGKFNKALLPKICLLRPYKNDDFTTHHLVPMIFPLIIMFVCKYLTFKVTRFMRGICPNNRMSSIGSYRRNLLTLEDTCKYLQYWVLWACVDPLLVYYSYINPIIPLSPNVVAAIPNFLNFIVIGFFYGFVLPIRMKIPWNPLNKSKNSRPFYVRQEKLEPRRPLMISSEEHCDRINVAMSTSSQVMFGASSFKKSTTKKKGEVKYNWKSCKKAAPLSEQVYLCERCDYTCEKAIILKKHVNTNHKEVKKYSGNQECSSTLKNTDTMVTMVTMDTVTCSCTEEVVCDKCLDKLVSKETSNID